jgi:type I restriction enzyme, S subunit
MDTADKLITENLDIWTSAVKAKSSAGRGASKKQELYGISKLREMIRGLGLSGGLCSPEGTFTKNLDHLLAEARKGYSVAQKRKLKDYKIGSPIISEFGIPENWEWKRVSELCDLQTGATPSRQKPEYFGGNNRWLVSGDINLGVIRDCEGRITDEALSASNCKILPQGTVLIALNGQGKTRASVALLETTAACNQSLVGIIPFDQSLLDPAFLLLALKYRYFEIRDVTGQKQRRGLNMGLVAELSVPVPPIEVQHRIVAKVDELMTLCDQLEKEQESSHDTHDTLVATLLGALTTATADAGQFAQVWQRIQANFDTLFTTESSIDQLKQTILQLAVMGKLVPQDLEDEPASELLKRIAQEKSQLVKEGEIKKQKPLPPVSSDKEPFGLPKEWEWTRLGIATRRIHYGYTAKSNSDITSVRLLRITDIQNDAVDWESVPGCEITDKETAQYKLLPGDILIARTGGTVGKSFLVGNIDVTSVFASYLIRLEKLEEMYPLYLKVFLSSPLYWEQLIAGARGAAQPNVNGQTLGAMTLPLPPLAEQHRIVAKVDELMALCDQLKARLATAQTTQLNLADSLVEQAIG